jgi:hypothetical protein
VAHAAWAAAHRILNRVLPAGRDCLQLTRQHHPGAQFQRERAARRQFAPGQSRDGREREVWGINQAVRIGGSDQAVRSRVIEQAISCMGDLVGTRPPGTAQAGPTQQWGCRGEWHALAGALD